MGAVGNEAEELNRGFRGLRQCLIATDDEMNYCFWTIGTEPPSERHPGAGRWAKCSNLS